MLARHDTTMPSHVELTPLSPTTWRVCDDRFDAGELRQVVGYLARASAPSSRCCGCGRTPASSTGIPTMEAALAAISVRLELTSHVR